MALEVVASQVDRINSDSREVVDMLREIADRIESGEQQANVACVVIADTSGVETFSLDTESVARRLQTIGLLNIALKHFVVDMG